MRILSFIIFITVFFILYGLINLYIFRRGWQCLPKDPLVKKVYIFGFLFVALSFFAGRLLENVSVCLASEILIWIGSFWFGFMAYLFLSVVCVDILRFSNSIFHYFPSFVQTHYFQVKQITALAVLLMVTMLMAIGYINARNPKIRKMEFEISKHASTQTSLTIALVTDIHMGTLIKNSRLNDMLEMIKEIDPDIVLLAGDIVDEDLSPVIENNMGEMLRRIPSRLGTYAVTGNHEYIGGVEEACAYLSDHGITFLRDSAVKIDDGFYLLGREDRSISGFTRQKRKPLKQLLEGVDLSYPLILLDHQPFRLKEAAQNGVDLVLCGHTHHGQLWPFNFITELVYEVSWGYKKVQNTHVYVSCGYGTWGPPVRIGSTPEVVQITLRFAQTD